MCSSDLASDKAPSGFGHWGLAILRKTGTNLEYRIRMRYAPAGIYLSAMRLTGTTSSTILSGEVASGIPSTPNQFVRIRAQAIGTNPTRLRAKAWVDGQPEPATWALVRTDSSAALQAPGSIGLGSANSATVAPVNLSYDDLTAVEIGRAHV